MSAKKDRQVGRVVLVGRPNVGKSTLFNRVAGSRKAIVTSVPGTTRDVLREPVEWQGTQFELVDTGGLFGASDDPMHEVVSVKGLAALDEADVLLMLVDGREGLIPTDAEVARRVRQVGVPVVLVVNKVDAPGGRHSIEEFHTLGFDQVLPIAAEHGLGVGDLLDALVARLPESSGQATDLARLDPTETAVAIVGRPNVGKSSLVNLLARQDRVLVSEVAGTTRDAVDTVIRWRQRKIRLVDTAGIRRPGRVAEAGQIESVSVIVARRALQRADVAVVVFDASIGVGRRDAAIAGEAERAGCGVVLAANKWDLVKGREEGFSKKFDQEIRDGLKFAEYAPIVHLSALTGERAPKLLEMVERVDKARGEHVATGELNRLLDRVTRSHPPASQNGREVKIQYATQVGVKPPRFLFFTNTASSLHFSYERFLTNRLRQAFGFLGSPIQLRFRAKRRLSRRSRRKA
jgi:GTP-binding protein